MGARWRYLLGEVGIGLRRNLLMTLATVVTVTVSLALLGAGLLLQTQVDRARDLFFAQVEVSIFLEDSMSDQQRVGLEQQLRANPEVSDVLYESKQEAFEHFQEIFAEDETVLEALSPEDLPASFRVSLNDPERFEVVASQYRGYPGVADVTDQRDLLDRFFSIMNSLRTGALAVAVLQGAAAAALISNTIRITAFARRQQTGIMKLVGATNWYIRLPFMLEGITAGVTGAILATGLLYVGMRQILPGLRQQIQFFPFIPADTALGVMPWLVLIGGGIAAVASYLSLRRFLDV